jgi:hypothetical protein
MRTPYHNIKVFFHPFLYVYLSLFFHLLPSFASFPLLRYLLVYSSFSFLCFSLCSRIFLCFFTSPSLFLSLKFSLHLFLYGFTFLMSSVIPRFLKMFPCSLLQVNVYVSHNLLNVLVQIANKMGLKKYFLLSLLLLSPFLSHFPGPSFLSLFAFLNSALLHILLVQSFPLPFVLSLMFFFIPCFFLFILSLIYCFP